MCVPLFSPSLYNLSEDLISVTVVSEFIYYLFINL